MRSLILYFLTVASLLAGPKIDVANAEGNSFHAEILALNDQETTVRRTSDQRIFVLSLDSLSASTRELLQENAQLITDVHPDYGLDMVVGKRRKKMGYYWIHQTISCKLNIENLSRELDSPGVKGRVILIGQNQRETELFTVLAIHDFEAKPAKTETAAVTLKEILTKYDSDNEGYGNSGGFKYEDYIVILNDLEGNLIETKTLNAKFEKELASQTGIIPKLLKIRTGTRLNEDFSPRPRAIR